MPTDKLDQLFGIEEIKAQQQQVIAIIDDTVAHITAASKQMRANELFVTDSNTLAQGTAAIKAATTAVDAHKASLEKLLSVKQQEQTLADAVAAVSTQNAKGKKDEADNTTALAQAISALNKERERLTAQAAQEAANARNLNASYEQLKKQYKDAGDNAKQLAAAQLLAGTSTDGFNTKTKDAISHAQNLGTQLNAAGTQIAGYQNKVDACKGVSEQFNKMLGELPKLAQSPGEFIKALSGHVADFAEQVVKARSEGQSWGSILTAIGGSLTGLPGIINLAITGLSFLAKAFSDSDEEASKVKQSIDDVAGSIHKLLLEQAKLKSRTGVFNGVISTTNIDAEKHAERELELMQQKYSVGKAIAEDVKKKEQEVYDIRIKKLKTTQDEIDLIREYYTFLKEGVPKGSDHHMLEYQMGLNDRLSNTFGKDRRDKLDEVLRQARKDHNDVNAVLDEYTVEVSDQKEEYDYQQKRNNITSDGAKSKASGSVKKKSKNISANKEDAHHSVALPGAPGADKETLPEEPKKAQQEQLDIYIAGQKQLSDAEANALKESLKMGLEKYKAQKELRDKNLKEEQAAAEKQQKIAERVGKAANFVLDEVTKAHEASSKRKNAALDDESKKIEQNKDDQLKALDTLNISEEEKAARTAKINADAAAGEARIQGEKRRQMAKDVQFERESALAKALVNLYLGVSKEVSGKGVIGIATATAIFTFMSSIIGAITSVKTPTFYAEGTGPGGHKGGDAVVGEKYIAGRGYQKELVRIPSRGSFITDGPAYIPDMPVRSEVIPLTGIEASDAWNAKLTPMPLPGGYGNLAQVMASMQRSAQPTSHTSVIIDNEGIRRIYTQGAYTRQRIETKITR